ncbi:17501_t:CDS:10, partial [Dentiscutata erythropus]
MIQIFQKLNIASFDYPDRAIGTISRKDSNYRKSNPYLKKNTYAQYQQELANKYGPLFTFTVFNHGRTIVSNDPRTIEHLVKTGFDEYGKSDDLYKIAYDVYGDGIFAVDGDLIYKSVIEKSKVVINILKKYADNGKPIDLQDLFYRFTMDTFGEHGKPLWKFIEKYSEKGRKMRKACKYIDNYVYNMINNHKSELEIEKKSVKNLLTLLIEAVDDNGKKFNDKELRDVIINLIAAGRDSTAQALSWMMYFIMVNQSVENLLLQEINKILSVETSIPSYDDIKLFKYTTATFYETAISYSSSKWKDSEDGLKPNKFKFAIFHAGPRSCLGQQFATLEAITLVVMLLKEFKFELVPGQKSPPEFKDAITLPMKDPLMTK